jgi:hypothetical protein
MALYNGFLPVEQEKNDAQCKQTNKPVFTESIQQGGKIGNDSAKEGDRVAKEDFDNNPKGGQQQEDFSDLAKPLFEFFEKMHN